MIIILKEWRENSYKIFYYFTNCIHSIKVIDRIRAYVRFMYQFLVCKTEKREKVVNTGLTG